MGLDFLRERRFVQEEMDNFDLSGSELEATLLGLSTINKYLGNTKTVVKALQPIILASTEPLRIIDLGCGGADLLNDLASFALSKNKEVKFIGIDGNANIINYAKEKSKEKKSISFLVADILSDEFILPKCDVLISSHFMYHFPDLEFIQFLNKSRSNISQKIIISELQRSVLSYVGFWILASIFRFPSMIKNDGLKAISRSFRWSELQGIFNKSRVGSVEIRWKWAFRYLCVVSI